MRKWRLDQIINPLDVALGKRTGTKNAYRCARAGVGRHHVVERE